jgi:hypothetical protein
MRILLFLSLALVGVMPLAGAHPLGDSLPVVAVNGTKATAHGEARGLLVGDFLYFPRSPFKFPITAVKGQEVDVAIPAGYDLMVGAQLLRTPNDRVQSNMQTEQKLKHAIED